MIKQDPASWLAGYRSAYAGEPSNTRRPASAPDSLAWTSGRIEGAADRAAGKPEQSATEALRRSFDERLAVLRAPDAGDRLREIINDEPTAAPDPETWPVPGG